ncbi:MAG: serine--tRNA ligase [Candidatus Aenigmarchaeota archaeon]|nr:serine--tRNA ligase [Candidatus Aenigmarchaeota archaeon]
MLDIKLIREHPEIVEKDLRKRGALDKIKMIGEVKKLDEKRRQLIQRADALKQSRNTVTREIARLKMTTAHAERANKPAIAKLLKENKEIPDKIRKLDDELQQVDASIRAALMRFPNILHESVPIGKDETGNVVVREWGQKTKLAFPAKDHIDIGIAMDLIDLERAAKTTGARFYYMKNELVLLNNAVIRFALDFLKNKGFALLQTPFMLRRKAIEGATDLEDFEQMIYKIEGEDLYMIATSEHAILGMHMDEILEALPLKYCAWSPCFRKEAGSHGRDTKGIFRIHQFEKVEQFIFCRPEESSQLHEELIRNAEEFFQQLKIPYRIVNICTGDIGTVAAKKYDLDAWLPGQQRYRELVSCSNCTDYQARRSGIRYRDSTSQPTKVPHTLNSTLTATERTLIAIMENYQTEDSIIIPDVLQKYMNGMKEIKKA